MTDIKTNIRDGAYVAIGAAALGVQHLSKKRDEVKARFDGVSTNFGPAIKGATCRVSETISPLTARITPVAENIYESVSTHVVPAASSMAEKVSANLGPVTSSVISQVKSTSNAAICSSKKIADEAKRRVS